MVTVTNNTPRRLNLGAGLVMQPKETLTLAPDAVRVLERPIVKSYQSDKSLTVQYAQKQKAAAKKDKTVLDNETK